MSGPTRRASAGRPHSDYRSYSSRNKLLGGPASRVAPAWRYSYQRSRPPPLNESELVNLGGGYARLPQQEGSKIYISHLPVDVDDVDINQLLTETIGPVLYAFVVCDSRGVTKLAAVASFLDPAHAAKAVELYNGKVIDGKEPIRVEQIGVNPKARAPGPPNGQQRTNSGQGNPSPPKSLLDRVAQAPQSQTSLLDRVSAQRGPFTPVRRPPAQYQPMQRNVASHPPPKQKRLVKKGPKRLQKVQQQQQLQQLEQEMDQYRKSAPNGLGLRT